MYHFNPILDCARKRPWLGMMLLLVSGIDARGDQLTLTNNDRLSGTVRSIDEKGTIELTSVLSAEPLLLKASGVEKIDFNAEIVDEDIPDTRIELRNGDQLPALIENLTDDSLTVRSVDVGLISIPRIHVKSLQIGGYRQKLIYSGPQSLDEWTKKSDTSRNWQFTDQTLVATGPAKGSKQFDLPLKFILKFTLKWESNPNFQIYLADPLLNEASLTDRYLLKIDPSGIEVKRETRKGKRQQSLILSNRTPDEFPEKKVDVELQVDRQSSRLHLLVNGEHEGSGIDSFAEKPVGNGITLICDSAASSPLRIENLQILLLDNAATRHRSEERGNPALDSLISRDEERWSGRLLKVDKSNGQTVFHFKSDFQDLPIELPESEISTLFLAQPAAVNSSAPSVQPFALSLRGDGSLRMASCVITENTVTAVHPLLGPLSIQRRGITALRRVGPTSKEIPKK